MRLVKIVTAAILLAVAGGAIFTHLSYRFFPAIPITLLVIGIGGLILAHSASTRKETALSIATIISATATIGWFIYAFPPSYIGLDPDRYARWSSSIIEVGGISGMPSTFYQDVPAGLVLPAITSIVTDLHIRHGMGVYAIILGILTPLLAVTFAARIDGRRPRLVIGAAVLGGVLAESIRYGYWPIPQGLAVLLFQVFLLALLIHVSSPSWESSFLLLVPLFVMMFTHKIPLALAMAVFLTFLLYHPVQRATRRTITNIEGPKFGSNGVLAAASIVLVLGWAAVAFVFASPMIAIVGSAVGVGTTYTLFKEFDLNLEQPFEPSLIKTPYTTIALLAAFLFTVQWTFQSGYLGVFVYNRLITDVGVSITGRNFIVATPASSYLPDLFFHESHALMLVLGSAIATLWLAVADRGKATIPVVAAGLFILLSPLSLTLQFTTGIGISRLLPNFSAVLAGVLAVTLLGIPRRKRSKRVAGAVLIVTLVVQAFAIVAVPDGPETPRYYLQQDEVDAKEFTHKHVEGDVTTDYWYATESISALPGTTTTSTASFHGETEGFVNAKLADQRHQYILLRTEPEVWRFEVAGSWVLTWDPEGRLDTTHSVVYDNENVILYANRSRSAG